MNYNVIKMCVLGLMYATSPTFGQAKLMTKISFVDSTHVLTHSISSSIQSKLANYQGLFIVNRSKEVLSDNKAIADGKARALVGADYLLNIEFKKMVVSTTEELNTDPKNGPCKNNTLMHFDIEMETSLTIVETGLIMQKQVFPLKFTEKRNCTAELNEHKEPFVDLYGSESVSAKLNDALIRFVSKTLPIEFPVLGQAYQKGNKISGVIVGCQNEGFYESQAFELYSRTVMKVGATTFDKNVFLCNAYYFEELGKYSTLLLRKPCGELQTAMENKERIIAVLKKEKE